MLPVQPSSLYQILLYILCTVKIIPEGPYRNPTQKIWQPELCVKRGPVKFHAWMMQHFLKADKTGAVLFSDSTSARRRRT